MIPQLRAEVRLQVPFYDVDVMNIVWHGHYLKYFELARCELLARIGYGYREMQQSGYDWPVVDLQVRYLKSATLGQELLCIATLEEFSHRLKIAYEICCPVSGARLTKGHSVQVAVNIATQEMQLVSPPVLLAKLGVA